MRASPALTLLLVLGGCQVPAARSVPVAQAWAEAQPYDSAISDAGYAQVIDRALARARADGSVPRKVLAVFGANWCHDSRALAGWLLDAGHAAALDKDFVVAFVDVGKPQEGHGRNLDLAARFGITGLKSTPALVVLDTDGHRLNGLEDSISWRNAASRSDTAIAAALARYATLAPAG